MKNRKLPQISIILFLTLLLSLPLTLTQTQAATLKAPKPAVKQINNYLQVSWNKVSGAQGYVIYTKNSKSASWKKAKTVSAGTVKYNYKTVSSGKRYYFTVRAYRKTGGKIVYGAYSKTGVSIVVKQTVDKAIQVTFYKGLTDIDYIEFKNTSKYTYYDISCTTGYINEDGYFMNLSNFKIGCLPAKSVMYTAFYRHDVKLDEFKAKLKEGIQNNYTSVLKDIEVQSKVATSGNKYVIFKTKHSSYHMMFEVYYLKNSKPILCESDSATIYKNQPYYYKLREQDGYDEIKIQINDDVAISIYP